MIHFTDFVFAAPPRTGSTWFVQAAAEVGLRPGVVNRKHEQFPDDHLQFPQETQGLRVSLVRHPYNWLMSYYLGLDGGAVNIKEVDVLVDLSRESKDLQTFLRRYVNEMPGTVTRIFDSYQANTILRLEDFPWSPIEFFASLGVRRRDWSGIEDKAPVNFRKGKQPLVHPFLRRDVCGAEEEFCDRYEYVP